MQLGVVSAPALGRRWWAERGGGAFASGERMHVSAVARSRGCRSLLLARERRPADSRAAPGTREGSATSGRTCSSPRARSTEPWTRVGVAEWDLAAVQVIVEEAGGRFSDFAGHARIDSGSAVTSNGLLHDELLAALATP